MPDPAPVKPQRPRGALVLAVAGVALMSAWVLASRREVAAPAPPSASAPPAASSAPSAPRDAPSPGAPITPEITTVAGDDAFQLRVFPVALEGARIRVVDMGMSRDLAGALARTGASLVVNAGFFDKETKPEGLVISEGAALSPASASLGGGVFAISTGRAALFAAEGYAPAAGVTFAVQARPRLVVEGKSNLSRDDGPEAERTALCARDEGRTLEVIVARGEAAGAGPTLGLFAKMLASRGCREALNLDGGPSTGVAWREAGGPRELAPRGPVRQAIAIWAGE